MFDIFDLFLSSQPHILRLLCPCLYLRILASPYPYVRVCLLVSLHPDILISSDSYVLAPILTSLHPHILRFMCACLYPCMFTSSYLQVHVCLFVYLHDDILISSVHMRLLVSSHPRIHRFMCACWYVNILRSICSLNE